MIARTELSIGQSLVLRTRYSQTPVVVMATEPWKAVTRNNYRTGRSTSFVPAATRSAKGVAVAVANGPVEWRPLVVSLDDLVTPERNVELDAERIAERIARQQAEERHDARQERMVGKIAALYAALDCVDETRQHVSRYNGGKVEINERMVDEILAALALRDAPEAITSALAEIGR